jgi:hypothetical protein
MWSLPNGGGTVTCATRSGSGLREDKDAEEVIRERADEPV